MTYFSRLTDIVTCNLTKLLAEADDPAVALQEIIDGTPSGLCVRPGGMCARPRHDTATSGLP